MKINHIKTDRLLLRGFTKDDALWAYSIWNDPEMGEFLPDEAKDNIDLDYIKELENLGDDAECCYLIPILKDSEQRVGTCSFMPLEGGKVYDIAYCVHKNFQCRGYATEIALGMIAYARCNGAEKVTIRVSKENLPSNRVAIKCGGTIARVDTYIKKGTGIEMDEYVYEVML